jgi:hypothetical protein
LGNNLQAAVALLPRYSLMLQAERCRPTGHVTITLEITLENADELQKGDVTAGERHSILLLLAEKTNNTLLRRERLAYVHKT